MPLGQGREWGGVQIRPAANPPPTGGLMLHSVAPSGGFTAQHPRPSWLLKGPPDTVHRPRSLRLGGKKSQGWGINPGPPTPAISLFFKRFPTTIGSVRKLIVYKYPKRRKTGWGGRKRTVRGRRRRLAAGSSPPFLSWQERVPSPHPKAGSGQPLP